MSQLSSNNHKMHQEDSKAMKIVNKLLDTLPKCTLKQFIYLLSMTIADEKGARLDTLSCALELVDNEIRANMITLFKDFGIEDHLIHDILSRRSNLSDTNTSSYYDNKLLKENYIQNNNTPVSNLNQRLEEKKCVQTSKTINDNLWENKVNIHVNNESSSQNIKYEMSKESSTELKNINPNKPKSNESKRVLNKKYAKKARFSPEESNFIVTLVENNDITNWTAIAKACNSRFGGNKTGPQCHQHYFRVANSSICKNPWRKEEDEMLKKLVSLYGYKWSQISQSLPGRPDTSCRRRWKAIQKNKD